MTVYCLHGAVPIGLFSKKRCNLQSANLRNEKPSCQKVESASFLEENSHGPRNLSQKLRKGCKLKKLASKLMKLEKSKIRQ
jgi:hypothetical protein